MEIAVVGGSIDTGKPSSVVNKLYRSARQTYNEVSMFNGFLPKNIDDFDLTLWMPNIDNSKEKIYPKKRKGSILICSKLLHDDVSRADAVSRIFKMNANAVIAITPKENIFSFELIDALGNTWVNTEVIHELINTILNFCDWSNDQKRISLIKKDEFVPVKMDVPEEFIQLNNGLADKVVRSMGSRYFGNLSTRCMSLFPNMRIGEELFLFSPRNVDKQKLTPNDFVLVTNDSYYGNIKPSVDTPVQLEIYKLFPNINFIIHGHAFIKDVSTTKNYFPCGDLREVEEVDLMFQNKFSNFYALNLLNHGFILMASDLTTLEFYSKTLEFEPLQVFK